MTTLESVLGRLPCLKKRSRTSQLFLAAVLYYPSFAFRMECAAWLFAPIAVAAEYETTKEHEK